MVAITGGRVFDGAGSVIEDGLVIINDKNIVSVTTMNGREIPANADRIDARGMFVMPGLIDAHNHLGATAAVSGSLESDSEVTLLGVQNAARHLRSGITTMRLCGERNYIDLAWRNAIEEGTLFGPRLIAAGRGVTSSSGHGRRTGWICDGPDAIREAVRINVRNQVDWIKLYATGSRASKGTIPDASYFSEEEIRTTIDEAHRMGKRVGTHCHGGAALDWSIDAGIDVIEHGTSITLQQADRMVADGIHLVATLGVYFGNDPATTVLDDLAPINERAFEAVGRAIAAGVRVAVGGDTRHAESNLVFELQCMARCGMSPAKALLSATSIGAEVCGIEDETGTLAVGKRADLLIVQGNPLENLDDLRNVRHVFKEGVSFHSVTAA